MRTTAALLALTTFFIMSSRGFTADRRIAQTGSTGGDLELDFPPDDPASSLPATAATPAPTPAPAPAPAADLEPLPSATPATAPIASPTPALRKVRKKKVVKPGATAAAPAPAATPVVDKSHTLVQSTVAWVRMSRNQRGFGVLEDSIGIPLPLQFSMFFGTFLTSSTGTSRSEVDMARFTAATWLYSPHWNNLGLAAQYTDSTFGSDNRVRGGLYYNFVFQVGDFSGFLFPVIFPAYEDNNGPRLYLAWFAKYWRFRLAGNGRYVMNDVKNQTVARPVLGFDVIKGFRLVVVYDYDSNLKERNGELEPGVEFSAAF